VYSRIGDLQDTQKTEVTAEDTVKINLEDEGIKIERELADRGQSVEVNFPNTQVISCKVQITI
jgi:hypothetical protein